MSQPAADALREDDPPRDVSALIGRVLGERYRVTGLLGEGGIGRVYRAQHLVLKREVALKVLLEHYQCVPDLQRRFEREAMALAAMSHPHIVTITDFVSTREVTFLVMELVEGRDLDDMLEEGPLPPDEAIEIMCQILSSLAYAHSHDVIHRDLKPQNVLIRDLAGGRKHATILDFGLAKFMDGSGPSANLTKTGLIVGTPAYMAPEQASGAHADQRADVYAAGVMLYEMFTGEHPFDGEGQELIRQHLLRPAPPLAAKAPDAVIAPELEQLVARALAKDGVDRFADGGAMLD
ncbi:MAG: serine/threonine-protein kinase, partial [Sandaracinaceae bacterium]